MIILLTRYTYLLLIVLLFASASTLAQKPFGGAGNKLKSLGSSLKSGISGGGKDSLQHRDKFADSLTIHFRYLDSARNFTLDSSVSDYTTRFPIPATNIYLGNIGLASRSILFSPNLHAGWDAGFHAFDIYKWQVEKVRFYNTTRPYTELNYQLASRSEQIIELLHTQNIKPNWNFSLQYRLINAPGFFKNQKTNHNNYKITSWYQSVNRRYNNYFVLLSNKLQASENGGLKDDQNYLDDPNYDNRFSIPVKLGGDNPFGTNFFSTKIGTGNKYTEFTVLMRQQYDIGQKDSIVTDSTVIPLFYPRLRFEHTVTYSTYKYNFSDISSGKYITDSAYYKDNYSIKISPGDSIFLRDRWKEIVNDFSIIQFPDAKNQQQFIKLGVAVQNLSGNFITHSKSFYNLYGHVEYRNKSRNQKWDIEAIGKLYFTGLNAANYEASASVQRYAGKKIGYLQLGFQNVNRRPSFIFDSRSSFYLWNTAVDLKNENLSHFFANLYNPLLKLKLAGHYYLLTNYTYFSRFDKPEQDNALFNLLLISAQKTFRLGKHWNWHADVYLQQVVGNAPVNVPQLFTRNRIAYEGNLGFKNLDIALGMEARYFTSYTADGYSPALGQFYYQDKVKIKNKTPDVSLYMNFRIRSFKTFFRADNLNTARSKNGFGFTNNNFSTPGYPYPGMMIRLGIYWSFVN